MMLISKNLAYGTTAAVFLPLTIGLSDMKPALAKSPSETPSVTKSSVTPHSSFTVAQLLQSPSPVYGTWKLQFSVGGILHESILAMQGHSGVMRTRYYNPNTRHPDSVDQTMTLRSSSQGLVLLGSNPVYAGSATRHPTYIPDNFLFQVNPDGVLTIVTCDRQRRCSPVDLQEIQ